MTTQLLKITAAATVALATMLSSSNASANEGTKARSESGPITLTASTAVDATPIAFRNSRYRWHNNHWWYWMPSNSWMIWYNGAWIGYDPNTYYTYYPGYYSYPSYGYYGGYGYPNVWSGYSWGNRGWRDGGRWRGGRDYGWNRGGRNRGWDGRHSAGRRDFDGRRRR
jgi:hypothetical protein